MGNGNSEEPGYAADNPPEDYGQTSGGCSFPWIIAIDQCFRTIQDKKEIANERPHVGGESTTTSNHPRTHTLWYRQIIFFNKLKQLVKLSTINVWKTYQNGFSESNKRPEVLHHPSP